MLNIRLLALTALLPLTLAATTAPGTAPSATTATVLKPTDDQIAATRMVYSVLSDSRFVYRGKALDDVMSQDIFKRYIEALDGDKLYFIKGDMDRFAAYQTTLDDSIRSQDLSPAFDIFNTYVKRVSQRVNRARALLQEPIDFTRDESFAFDRENAQWAVDGAALDSIWRKYVKNDALRLRLAGRSDAEWRKTLDKRYGNLANRVSQLRGDDVFESFMNAYATSIDPHTSYMSPRSAETFNMTMRLSLQGIGAVLQRQDEFVVIRTIVPGGPAQRGGALKVGDRVLAVGQGVDGPMLDVVGWRIDDVVEKIRGDKGTTVRLDVLPADASSDGKPERVVIVRDKVKLEEQAAKKSVIDIEGKRIGIIELPTFYLDFEARRRGDSDTRSATSDVAKLLREFSAEKVDGVVVDLRDNGGGSLIEAIELTGLFIDQGPVVQVRETGGRVSVESDRASGVAWTGPLAVLVNRSSASASEIFAAAIQDYGRGLIIGEPTFGKGTVQNLIPLDRWNKDGEPRFGQLKLTVAQFFRVDGGTTQHAGVVPDLQFPMTLDASEFGESSYDNALPATQIDQADYGHLGNFGLLGAQLRAQHQARVAGEREFAWWAQDVAEYRIDREQKSVSLNEKIRRAERDRDESRRKQRRAERIAAGIEVADDVRSDDGLASDERSVADQAAAEEAAKKRPDPLLKESAEILADAVDLLSGSRGLTAQVLPVTQQAKVWAQ